MRDDGCICRKNSGPLNPWRTPPKAYQNPRCPVHGFEEYRRKPEPVQSEVGQLRAELERLRGEVALLSEIKSRAASCRHADDACGLVYYINDTVNADACWRSRRATP